MTSRCHPRHRIRLIVARTVVARMKGLLGRARAPSPHIGLWIFPCRAVHTFGMRFPIDVAFIDREGKVTRLVRNLKPGRIAACFGAKSVIEMAVNSCDSPLRYRRRLHIALRRSST